MIKIFKDNVEIEVYKETLTINRDNKFLDNDFKIQANSYPFMIVENESTRKALGSRLPTSTFRDTFHKVQVLTPEGTFEGELQILSYLKNSRKCNLRFYSPIYNLRDKKISEFLPERISVITSVGVEPNYGYEEKRDTLITKEWVDDWTTFGANQLNKGFPEVLFNFPDYSFPNKFGDDLQEDDDWFKFRGGINRTYYDAGIRYMSVNSYSVFAGEVRYDNHTVNSPQIYLLAPLKQAVESLGYKVKGNFYENDFIKRLLFYSDKDNLCEIELNDLIKEIQYVSGGWQMIGVGMSFKQILFQLPVGRRYKVEMEVKNLSTIPVKAQVNVSGVGGNVEVQIFENPPLNEIQTYSAEFVPPYTGTSTANVVITFVKRSWLISETLQINSIKIYEIAEKKGYLSHPIINLQRYVPDWSFIDYINELKKLFNLKITPNDHDKTISFDFFNDQFVQKTGVKIDSVYIDEFETHEFDSLLLKYDNEEDDNVFVTKNSITVAKNKLQEHTKEVGSKFKFMPVTSNGLILTEEIEDKSGVGLVIYNHSNTTTSAPVQNYQGYDLTLKNIYEKNYQLSFKNYLSSGVFPADAFLSNKQIKDIAQEDFVFIDNKRYYVNTMSYKETPNGSYETKFELLLMMY